MHRECQRSVERLSEAASLRIFINRYILAGVQSGISKQKSPMLGLAAPEAPVNQKIQHLLQLSGWMATPLTRYRLIRDSMSTSVPHAKRRKRKCHREQRQKRVGGAGEGQVVAQGNDDGLHLTEGCTSPIQTILPNDIISNIIFGGYLDDSPMQLAKLRMTCRRFNSLARTSFSVLDIRPPRTFTTRAFSKIIDQFRCLKEVDVSFLGSSFTDRHMEVISSSSLRSKLIVLKLRGTVVSDKGVAKYFQYKERMVS